MSGRHRGAGTDAGIRRAPNQVNEECGEEQRREAMGAMLLGVYD